MRDREVGAAGDQPAIVLRMSGDRRRQLNGNKAEFAILSNEGPAGPCTPQEIKNTGLCQASCGAGVEHRPYPNSGCKHHAAMTKLAVK